MGPLTYPRLGVAVASPDDTARFLDHLQDGAAVDIAHNVGIIWPHNPEGERKTDVR